MGYDMHTVTKPEGEERAVARVTEEFRKACAVRDALPKSEAGHMIDAEWRRNADFAADATPAYKAAQSEVSRLFEVMRETERSYFRLNIWGMGQVREAMLLLGMAYESESRSEWPDYPSGVAGQVCEALSEDADPAEYLAKYYPEVGSFTEADLDTAKLYRLASEEIRREHPEGGSVIPVHKFGSNDGWIVTPAECLEALSVWYAHTPGERDDALTEAKIEGADWMTLWERWLRFLELAAHCDGFEVY